MSLTPEGKININYSDFEEEELEQQERYDQVVKEMDEDKELVSKFKKYDA